MHAAHDPRPMPVVMLLGATASGKSALAIALAQRLGGEIISADAMAVYRGMDIGTAKPDAQQLGCAPHHLISCLEVEERCDVARWLRMADAALAGIASRQRVAIVAGGSPLYAKVLLEGLSAGAPRDECLRSELNTRYEVEGGQRLYAELQRLDPAYAASRHPNDRKRIVRALEVQRLTGRPYSSFHTTNGMPRSSLRVLSLGVARPREVLHQRIAERVDDMFRKGLVEEVRALATRLSVEAMQAVGYKEILGMLRGDYDERVAHELVCRNTRRLAKHQLTWYRSWAQLQWLPGDATDLVDQVAARARAFLEQEPEHAQSDHSMG